MPLYIATVAEGELKGKEVFRSEVAQFVTTAADNYKRDTGANCQVESRTVVYTTQTLDEAMAEDARSRTLAAGFAPGACSGR